MVWQDPTPAASSPARTIQPVARSIPQVAPPPITAETPPPANTATPANGTTYSYSNLPTEYNWSAQKAPVTNDTVYYAPDGSGGQYYVGPDNVFYHLNHLGPIGPNDIRASNYWTIPGTGGQFISSSAEKQAQQQVAAGNKYFAPVATGETVGGPNVSNPTELYDAQALIQNPKGDISFPNAPATDAQSVVDATTQTNTPASSAPNSASTPKLISEVIPPPTDAATSTFQSVVGSSSNANPLGNPSDALSTLLGPQGGDIGAYGGGGIGNSNPAVNFIPTSSQGGSSNNGLMVAIAASIIAGGIWYYVEHRRSKSSGSKSVAPEATE